MKVPIPIQGVFTKAASTDTPPAYTEHSSNVRSIDTQEGKIRIGQRPGQKKAHTDQIGGSAQPIVAMIVTSIVENTEA
jgi:hypothetical protein